MFGLFKKKAKAERCYDVTRIQYELVVMSSKLIKKQTDMFKVIKGEREETLLSKHQHMKLANLFLLMIRLCRFLSYLH